MSTEGQLLASFWKLAGPSGRCARAELRAAIPEVNVDGKDDAIVTRDEFLASVFKVPPSAGTGALLASAMRARAAYLLDAASQAPQRSKGIAAVWPEGAPAFAAPERVPEDDRWEEILVRFGACASPAELEAWHLGDVAGAPGTDANALRFPHMEAPSSRGPVLPQPSPTGPGAAVQQDSTPFPLPHACSGAPRARPAPDAVSWAEGGEAETGAKWIEGHARAVGDLRAAIYTEEPLDTKLTPWPMLEGKVIEEDRCTEVQLRLIETRAERGPPPAERVDRRRRFLAKLLGGPLNLRCFDEVGAALEKEASLLEMRARWARDKAQAERERDEQAEFGAQFVAWPLPGEGKWAVDPAWTRRAKWLKMWRSQPQLPSLPAPGGLKRSSSDESLASWAAVSEVSWVEVESQAHEQGWQAQLDLAVLDVADLDLDQRVCTEIKCLCNPPADVIRTMQVICVLLGERPKKVLGVSDWWETSKKVLGDANFLSRLHALRVSLPAKRLEAAGPYIAREDFRPEIIKKSSVAAAALCKWARALYKYHALSQAAARAAEAQLAVKPKEELAAAAEAAVVALCKKDLQELKSLCKPPCGVDVALMCAVHLLAGTSPAVEVTPKGNVKHPSWRSCQKFLGNPVDALQTLISFKDLIDQGRVPARNVEAARRLKGSMGADFTPETMATKSSAAAGICRWVINIIAYYDLAAPPVVEETPAAPAPAKKAGPTTPNGAPCAPSKSDLVELRALGKPPAAVQTVCACLLHLLAGLDPQISVDDEGRAKEVSWKTCKGVLASVELMKDLCSFTDKVLAGQVPKANFEAARRLLDSEAGEMTEDKLKKVSKAAAGLYAWTRSVIAYHERLGTSVVVGGA